MDQEETRIWKLEQVGQKFGDSTESLSGGPGNPWGLSSNSAKAKSKPLLGSGVRKSQGTCQGGEPSLGKQTKEAL